MEKKLEIETEGFKPALAEYFTGKAFVRIPSGFSQGGPLVNA
ncbi:hypothetical protein [Pedobacter hiemivivus]|nr:hypothetical protein [Pedobacter hiemivivus]